MPRCCLSFTNHAALEHLQYRTRAQKRPEPRAGLCGSVGGARDGCACGRAGGAGPPAL